MSDSFAYSVYGLHIRSDFALWPWVGDQQHPSGIVDASIELTRDAQVAGLPEFRPGLQDAVLRWPDVATFRICAGEIVQVTPAPGVSMEDLALVAAGPVLALLLEQRGCVVLHGSCVDLGGRAITLLGPSGSGKSTIAASLREAGHALISDGMTVVDCLGAEPLALPGPPHLKLWPDAIGSLRVPPSQTIPVARQQSKLWYRANGGVTAHPVPLREAFLIEAESRVKTERLAPAASLVGLVRNYFLADFADADSRAFILNRCSTLASRLAVSTLQRGSSLGDLPSVLACVAD